MKRFLEFYNERVLAQSLAQSLEPSERGSDDCPILSEDSFTGFSDCAEW